MDNRFFNSSPSEKNKENIYLLGMPLELNKKGYKKYTEYEAKEKIEYIKQVIASFIDKIKDKDPNYKLIIVVLREYAIQDPYGAPVSRDDKDEIIENLQQFILNQGRLMIVTGGIPYYTELGEEDSEKIKNKIDKIKGSYIDINKKYPKLYNDPAFIEEENNFVSRANKEKIESKSIPTIIHNKTYVLDGNIVGKSSKKSPAYESERIEKFKENSIYNPGKIDYPKITTENFDMDIYTCREIAHIESLNNPRENSRKPLIQLVCSSYIGMDPSRVSDQENLVMLHVDSKYGCTSYIRKSNNIDQNLRFIPVTHKIGSKNKFYWPYTLEEHKKITQEKSIKKKKFEPGEIKTIKMDKRYGGDLEINPSPPLIKK